MPAGPPALSHFAVVHMSTLRCILPRPPIGSSNLLKFQSIRRNSPGRGVEYSGLEERREASTSAAQPTAEFLSANNSRLKLAV